jgi:hypothetical protein
MNGMLPVNVYREVHRLINTHLSPPFILGPRIPPRGGRSTFPTWGLRSVYLT